MANVRDKFPRPDLYYQDVRSKQRMIPVTGGAGMGMPQTLRDNQVGSLLPFSNYPIQGVANLSVYVAPDRSNRAYLLVQNNGAADMYVTFGQNADATNGVVIVPGGNYEPFYVPTNSVNVFSTGVLVGILIEGVYA